MSFWNNRNVFVTGSTGFLGMWLTDALVQSGANVVCLVRDWNPRAPFFLDGIHDRVTTVRGALEDYACLERAINEYEIESVFHLAAQAIVGVANRNPLATFETNIAGTWNLLEACRRVSTVKRVVVASSDKAYGDHGQRAYDEGAPLAANHPYDVSKACADLIAQTYAHTYKLPVSITRCGNLFGPGDLNFSRIIPGTIQSIHRGERPIIRSDGSPKRDYVFVKDIVQAYLTLAEQMDRPEVRGRGWNFGTGTPLSVLELIRLLLDRAGAGHIEPDVRNEAKGEILHQYLSSDAANRELGWFPGAPLADRLSETIHWYRSYFERSAASAVLAT